MIAVTEVPAPGKKLSEMSISEIKAAALESDNVASTAHKFTEEAIAAEREDIFAICWDSTTYCRHFLMDAFDTLPDGKAKNAILLAILKSPITNLLYADSPMRGYAPARKNLAEMVIPALRKTVPDVPIDYDQISTLEKRLKLAEAMETALGVVKEEPNGARTVTPRKQDATSRGSGDKIEKTGPEETAAGKEAVGIASHFSWPLEIAAAAAAILAGLCVWYFGVRRRKG